MGIKVVFMDLPITVRGFTARFYEDGEEYFTVIINSRLSRDVQRETAIHEYRHIYMRDFDSQYSADKIESMRHA